MYFDCCNFIRVLLVCLFICFLNSNGELKKPRVLKITKKIQRQTQSQVVPIIGLVAPLKLRKQFSWYEYKTLGKGNDDPSNSALGVESGFHH